MHIQQQHKTWRNHRVFCRLHILCIISLASIYTGSMLAGHVQYVTDFGEREEKLFPQVFLKAETSTSARHKDYVVSLLRSYPICRSMKAGKDAYVCQGPEYENFSERFEQFILLAHNETNTFRSYYPAMSDRLFHHKVDPLLKRKYYPWGQRLVNPLPPNVTILAMGNSHTRQIIQTMECQYRPSSMTSYQRIDTDPMDQSEIERGAYYRIEFDNGALIHLITNHIVLYTPTWQRRLEKKIGRPLQELDAIVLGTFNSLDNAIGFRFQEKLKQQLPHNRRNFTFVDGPSLLDVAQTYRGPVVAHSLMADWNQPAHSFQSLTGQRKQFRAQEERLQSRANDVDRIRVVNGYRYIRGILGECGTDSWQSAGKCERSGGKHPCFGYRGGHSDLLVWDIIEVLNLVLLSQRKSN